MKCEQCGKVIRKDSISCRHCGHSLSKASEKKTQNISGESRGGKVLFLISLFVFIIFLLASMGVKPVITILDSFYSMLGLPFKVMKSTKFYMLFPNYFIYNILISIASGIFVVKGFSFDEHKGYSEDKKPEKIKKKKDKKEKPEQEPRPKKWFRIFSVPVAAVILILVYIFVVVGRFFTAQDILFIIALMTLGAFFYIKDKKDGIDIFRFGIIEKHELPVLISVVFIMIGVYFFDWKSWKYVMIGDEHSFYYFAKSFMHGIAPLKLLYEEGVYGYHSVVLSAYQGMVMKFFPNSYIGWKFSVAIIPALSLIPFYYLAKMMFDKRTAVISSGAFIFATSFMAFARIGYDNIIGVFSFVTAFLAVELALRKKSFFLVFLAAVLAGFCFYSHQTARLIAPVVILYWFFHPKRGNISASKVFIGSGIFAAVVLPIILSGFSKATIHGNFIQNMAVNTFAENSGVPFKDNAVFMVSKLIHTIFTFMHNKNFSHFSPFPVSDPVTAAGVVLSFAWIISCFKRDWRAKFMAFFIIIVSFLIGSVSEYPYPPNTRLFFLVIVFSLYGGVGINAVINNVFSKFDLKINKYYVVFPLVAIIIGINLFLFFGKMAENTKFSGEAACVKCVEENRDMRVLAVTQKFHNLPMIMDFSGYDEKRFEMIDMAEFENRIISDKLLGTIPIFFYDVKQTRPEVADFVKQGSVCMTEGKMKVENHYFRLDTKDKCDAFKKDWLERTGPLSVQKSQYVNIDHVKQEKEFAQRIKKDRYIRKMAKKEAKKVAKKKAKQTAKQKVKKIKKGKTGFIETIKNMFSKKPACNVVAPLDNGDPGKLKVTPLQIDDKGIFSDIAVANDGGKIFLSDNVKGRINIYRKKSDSVYAKEKYFRPHGRLKDSRINEPVYMSADKKNGLLYVLDCATGMITQYDLDGKFIKTVLKEGYLLGARSIEYSDFSGGLLAVTVSSKNGYVIYDIKGNKVKENFSLVDDDCSTMVMPSFITIDKKGNRYVVDAAHNIIKVFSDEDKYIKGYETVTGPTIYGAQMIINESWKQPYAAITMRHVNSLRLHLIDSADSVIIEFGRNGVPELPAPSPLEIDSKGALYIVAPHRDRIVRVELPENPFDIKGKQK